MAASNQADLKLSIIKLDEQILNILVPHHDLTDIELKKVATLEKARGAAQRLLKASSKTN